MSKYTHYLSSHLLVQTVLQEHVTWDRCGGPEAAACGFFTFLSLTMTVNSHRLRTAANLQFGSCRTVFQGNDRLESEWNAFFTASVPS